MIKKSYHLNLQKRQIKNAKIALLPGDPFRVVKIAKHVRQRFGGHIAELAWKREFKTMLCSINKHSVLVTSTGIGGSSTSIVIEELAMLGVRTFIRVGTTGAIQKEIRTGDVIITTGSVRLDGTSIHYAPIEYPAVADHEIVHSLIEAAIKSNIAYHAGITASSATFYPGQERYDSFSGYVLRRFQGSLKELQILHVLNYEMESATVLTLCSSMKLRGGCISGVVVNRIMKEKVTERSLKLGEENAIRVAVTSLEYFL